jgi:hypothetical protein
MSSRYFHRPRVATWPARYYHEAEVPLKAEVVRVVGGEQRASGAASLPSGERTPSHGVYYTRGPFQQCCACCRNSLLVLVSWLYGEGEQDPRADSRRAHGERNNVLIRETRYSLFFGYQQIFN